MFIITYPVTLSKDEARQAVCTGCREAGRRRNEALIHDCNLKEVLGKSSRVQVIVVSLADSSEEAHRSGPAELEMEHAQHESLSLGDFVGCIATVNHVHNLLQGRTVDLLVLGSNEHGCCPNELKFSNRDNLVGQEAVNIVDRQEECLWQEVEPLVDLHQPVHKH